MSEKFENAPISNEIQGDALIDQARAMKKGAIALGGFDKQSPEYLESLSPLTPEAQAEYDEVQADFQEANAQAGIQDPLSHLSDEQKEVRKAKIYEVNDASVLGQWDQERVDRALAEIDARYGVKAN